MTFEMCMSANISKEHIYEVSVAANTTMLHFLLGIKSNSIGKSPYAPAFVKSKSSLKILFNSSYNARKSSLNGVMTNTFGLLPIRFSPFSLLKIRSNYNNLMRL